MNDDTQAVMVGALVVTAVAVTSAICLLVTGPDPVDLDARQYCEMVGIYHQTNGEYGWPDYKKIYEQECTK